MIRKYVQPDQKNWDEVLPLMMLAYRSSVHETTGYSPAKLNFGRELKLPIDLVYGQVPTETCQESYHEFVDQVKTNLEVVHEKAKKKMILANKSQKQKYDTKTNQNKYTPGQHVGIASKIRTKGKCPKLQVHWNGPYIVLSTISDLVHKVKRSKAEKPKYVHHDPMKPFRGVTDINLSF